MHNHSNFDYKPEYDGKTFTLSRFWLLIKDCNPPMSLLVIGLILSLFTSAAGLVVPMFTKGLVNGLSLADIKTKQIIFLAGVFILQMLFAAFATYCLNYGGQKIVSLLRKKLWKKIIALPLSYFDNHDSGSLVSRITNDTAVIKELISTNLSSFVSGIISIIGSFLMLLYLDWHMTLVMLTAFPLAFAVIIPLGTVMRKISKKTMDETASFTGILSEVLGEIRLVKISNAEKSEYDRGSEKIEKLFKLGIKEGIVQALTAPLMTFITMALLVVIIGYGGVRISSGSLSAGDLVAFILYIIQVIMPLTQLTLFFNQFNKTRDATESIIDLLNTEQEDLTKGNTLKMIDKIIHINHLLFQYSGSSETQLNDIDMTLEPGKITAIVGPSGGGKTTLFSLLERFYEPCAGNLLLGDTNVNSFSLQSWREKIGYVSQESPMMSGSIRENLCYGLEKIPDEQALEKAVEYAYASEFVHNFPEGFDTPVGERGVKLSGGQKQRLAIARAFLRNPEILMLDEATANLDSDSEVAVQKALINLMKNRTVLIIAHRLSTVVDADKILFIDHGNITGAGSHEELMKNHPLYRRFAQYQLRGQLKTC